MQTENHHAISIRNLKKTYDNGHQALKGIDLDVRENDFFALLGPNGAGKSTIIGIISTLVRATSGQIQIFGRDVATDVYQTKLSLGVVPQEVNFSQFEKVGDIVMTQAGYYGLKGALAKERTEKYLKKLDLWDKRDNRSRMLSGGMKRRLMIARALVHEPRLLILDEPTAGVDIELRRSMWDFLQEINRSGTTIILTTHYLEEAEHLCRNIAIINHGEIVENTSMRSLLGKLARQTLVFDTFSELSAAPTFEDPDIHSHLIDSHSFEVSMSTSRDINALFNVLSQQNVLIKSMRNKTNRLEELFLSSLSTQK
ncbi:MAG: ABC transporter [Gammaproteobacteria bacterium]|nr:ABC transporter [Pseudohongiella sp.]MAO39459.1 ABC transporter [Pseudohongiella sp.]MAY56916.1 ABC transporter [Gammaproteobacteria bacterium]MBJ56393.1 ABC transporter [Gammaproteobacteria bacterium]|tara:strand:- start:1907 stop:2842 length:936 start_codon:yes stop_codon:yes gene_type:complete